MEESVSMEHVTVLILTLDMPAITNYVRLHLHIIMYSMYWKFHVYSSEGVMFKLDNVIHLVIVVTSKFKGMIILVCGVIAVTWLDFVHILYMF